MSYASPDKTEGVYVLRLYPLAGSYTGGQQGLQALSVAAAKYVVSLFAGHGLPADLSEYSSYTSTALWDGVSDMMVAGYKSQATGTGAVVGAGIIAPNGVAGGAIAQDKAVASNVVDDYAIAVTVVYGTQSSGLWSGNHTLGMQTFSSWSLLSYG
jgi:hypothetical protein